MQLPNLQVFLHFTEYGLLPSSVNYSPLWKHAVIQDFKISSENKFHNLKDKLLV